MAESVVLQTTREWRNNLTQLENRQTRSMVQRWLRIERNLDAQIIQLTQEIYEMRQQGVEPTLGRLYRLARFQELQEQIRQELRAYENFAETSSPQTRSSTSNWASRPLCSKSTPPMRRG